MEPLAAALRRIPFKIFCSSKPINFWAEYGLLLSEVQFDPSVGVDKAKYIISRSSQSCRMYFYQKVVLPSPLAYTLC